MRILVVHNYYEWRGGEDMVVDDEVALLRRHGHEVRLLARTASEARAAGAGALARDVIWSPRTHAEVDGLLRARETDVVHVHNVVPLVSPSVYWAASRLGVPVVQTIHNFRLACLAGTLTRDDRPCDDCVGRSPWRGVLHACYRGSRIQSAGLATSLSLHRAVGTWRRHVRRFIALSGFARDKLIAAGLPPERIVIKPNAVDVPDASALDNVLRTGGLFVGRLSPEKGLGILTDALDTAGGARVDVAGDGPLRDALATDRSIRLLGRLEPAEVFAAMRRARYLVLPSLSPEGFPRVIAEAFGSGLPVIASAIGSLPELVAHERTGLLVRPGDPRALAAALAWAESHPEAMAEMGRRCRVLYEAQFAPARNHERLLEIYAGLAENGLPLRSPAVAAGRR